MASCENKYTTLLDLSRQAKVITGETACFDGKIQVGIPFSGYPTGIDTGTTVSLGVVSSETAVFSGNTGTTVFDVSNQSYCMDKRFIFWQYVRVNITNNPSKCGHTDCWYVLDFNTNCNNIQW